MPMDRSKYPDDWEQISARVRARANNECEWCHVKNGARGARDRFGVWHDEANIHGMSSDHGFALFGDFPSIVTIVLTVAHLGLPREGDWRCWGDKHDKFDVRDGNLCALCQRCHLGYDRDDHLARQRENRAARKFAATVAKGQAPLEG